MMGKLRAWLETLITNNRIYLKMGFLLALVLVLLVPLELIEGLIAERMLRRDMVVDDISRTWGAPQVLEGPVLIVPYRKVTERRTPLKVELVEQQGQAFWLPDSWRSGQRSCRRCATGVSSRPSSIPPT